jgi:hypothetical protein
MAAERARARLTRVRDEENRLGRQIGLEGSGGIEMAAERARARLTRVRDEENRLGWSSMPPRWKTNP